MTLPPKMTVLKVAHDGDFKMVGKVFPVPDKINQGTQWVWEHEESGGQMFKKFHGPGMDVLAVLWCLKYGVEWYHHLVTGIPHLPGVRRGLYCIRMDRLIERGDRREFGGRDRLIVDIDDFIGPDTPWYRVPWVTASTKIEAAGLPWEALETKPLRRARKKHEVNPNQLSFLEKLT